MESYHETANGSNVDIWLEAGEPRERFLEPVTCSLPWPRGMLKEDSFLILRDDQGQPIPLQTRILDRWPDGSVRWLLLDWQASVKGDCRYRLQVSELPEGPVPPPAVGVRIQEGNGRITIDTGRAEFRLAIGGPVAFRSAFMSFPAMPEAKDLDTCFFVEDKAGRVYEPVVTKLRVEDPGPIRACIAIEAELREFWAIRPSDADQQQLRGLRLLAPLQALLHVFAGSPTVRYSLTIGNPGKANHPGGFWELGEKGSILLRGAFFAVDIPYGGGPTRVRCSPEPGCPFEDFGSVALYQGSSGSSNWQSRNHINRHGVVPPRFQGYRSRYFEPSKDGAGLRASPIVLVEYGTLQVALTMRHFWQNFPKKVAASEKQLLLELFPHQMAGLIPCEIPDFHGYLDHHEIQAGEQKTHEFVVAFGKDTVTAEPLAWVRSPLRARADPAWYCSTGAVPYLTPEADDPNKDYVRLVRAAIEGEDTFEKKRELVDEYGWRHFGDIYADHEAVNPRAGRGSPDPAPFVSHYNNQYDPLAGFALQFLRSGDFRWWSAMEELASHVIDIDIYHTDRDKPAYNHGLFWHTVHYTDAGLSTHRSYPRAPGVRGGGPANEHNYTTGLMLHYFLTGNPRSRQAAIDLAQWVIDMDDGTKTIFRWLDRGPTGLASATVSPLYHGPGRGAGNSVQALLDGHRLTGEPKFLETAEQLIRRCIHPADDIAARQLLDAERRWSYTVFLQALGRYLDYQEELGKTGQMYVYARAALLHYARWMADNEYPYLEKPEILEYPTETWAAQDMRKSEVFKFAAKHSIGDERYRFLGRSEYFFRYVTNTLSGMKTRTLARPVVILLLNGFMHAHFQKHPDQAAPVSRWVYYDVGSPEVFVPQKVRAKKRLLALLAAAAILAIIGLLGLFF
jgi:hypothetical protein